MVILIGVLRQSFTRSKNIKFHGGELVKFLIIVNGKTIKNMQDLKIGRSGYFRQNKEGEGESSQNLNGASLHRAFHVHPSIVSKWLKYCWRDVKP